MYVEKGSTLYQLLTNSVNTKEIGQYNRNSAKMSRIGRVPAALAEIRLFWSSFCVLAEFVNMLNDIKSKEVR